jgi:hypothetical protein
MRHSKLKPLANYLLTVAAILVLSFREYDARAATQRIALLPESFAIKPGESVTKLGYSLDETLHAPASGRSLMWVLSNPKSGTVAFGTGSTVSFPQAVAKGYIELRRGEEDLDIELQNKTSETARLTFEESQIIADGYRSIEDIGDFAQILNAAETLEVIDDKERLQKAIWDGLLRNQLKRIGQSLQQPQQLNSDQLPGLLSFVRENGSAHFLLNRDLGLQMFHCESGHIRAEEFEFRCNGSGTMEPIMAGIVHDLDRRSAIESFTASTRDTIFISFSVEDGGESARCRVQIGRKELDISAVALRHFISGGEVPREFEQEFSGLKKRLQFVIHRSELESADIDGITTSADDSNAGYLSSSQLAEMLQEKFGDQCSFFLADNPNVAFSRQKEMPLVFGGQSIQVLDDSESLDENDQAIVREVEKQLKAAAIDVISCPNDLRARNILVVTGRKDVALLRLLNQLNKSNQLRGRLLAIFSCGESAEESFDSLILSQDTDGPRGVLYYPKQVHPQAVQELLLGVAETINDPEFSGAPLHQVLQSAIKRSLDKPTNAPLRASIERLLSILQISLSHGIF